MTLRQFIDLFYSDMARFAEHNGIRLTLTKKISIFFMPSIQALFIYRLGRFLYLRGWPVLPRLLFTINILLWGIELPPTTRIGRSLYMPHTVGVTVFAVLGDRCTCYAQAAIGGGSGNEKDIGAGPGLPVLGDFVQVGARSIIVGPVRIGSGSLIGANAFITFDVPESSTVIAPVGKLL
jgi:serine O-acetyltransferase